MNNEKKPTYTLWNGSTLIDTYDHTRDGYDSALERAYDLNGKATIYSSRDDLVWSSCDDEQNECRMTDVEADADTFASAGYGTDEDYGYYGDDCYDY